MSTRIQRLSRTFLLALPALALLVFAPSKAEAQAEPVFDLADLSTPPRLVSMERAADQIRRAYPSHLRNRGVTGRVQIEVVVGIDGKVEEGSVRVLFSEHEELGRAAEQVAPQLAFRPGEKGGSPVRSRVIIPVVFQP